MHIVNKIKQNILYDFDIGIKINYTEIQLFHT